jgi:hypothetical protein
MKAALFFLISALVSAVSFGQSHQLRIFVFVPGAWDGGWDYAAVDSIKRHCCYREHGLEKKKQCNDVAQHLLNRTFSYRSRFLQTAAWGGGR